MLNGNFSRIRVSNVTTLCAVLGEARAPPASGHFESRTRQRMSETLRHPCAERERNRQCCPFNSQTTQLAWLLRKTCALLSGGNQWNVVSAIALLSQKKKNAVGTGQTPCAKRATAMDREMCTLLPPPCAPVPDCAPHSQSSSP